MTTQVEGQRNDAGVLALFRAVIEYAGANLWPVLAIVALAAVLESVGIVLLLPVAETIFAQSAGPAESGITGRVTGWLAELGIDTVLGQLAVMGAGFIALAALRAVVLLRRDIMLSKLSQGFVDHERQRFFAMLAYCEWPVIKRYRKSHLLTAMTTNIGRLAMTMQFISNGIVTAAIGLAAIGAAFAISTTLGLLLLSMVAVGLACALLWSRRSRISGERLTLANRNVMAETTRFLDGLKAAKAARAEDLLTKSFGSRIAETRQLSIAFVRQQGKLRNGIQLISAIAALLVLLVGFGMLDLSGGELLVMAAIILRLAPSLITIFGGVQSVAHALPAFTAIRELEAELAQAHRDLAIAPAESEASAVDDASLAPLVIDNCVVRAIDESGASVDLVRTGKLAIAPGTLVHIGGPSGAGKSTLAELVAGLHLPAAGSISRGSLSLQAANRRMWQAQVSFAPQEPFLFDASLRENLCWPNLAPGDDEIWRALEDAEVADLVRALPAGLDEQLLDGGARLSGGERQRLCVARALLRPAGLLILDEATSAMDPDLERAIVATIKRRSADRIVIMVSHSRNAVEFADMRIEVAAGRARVVS